MGMTRELSLRGDKREGEGAHEGRPYVEKGWWAGGGTPKRTRWWGGGTGGSRTAPTRGKCEGEGGIATRFFTPLRCVQNDMWEGRDGFPHPVFTGEGFRREDNGWGRTPAATEGENGRDEGWMDSAAAGIRRGGRPQRTPLRGKDCGGDGSTHARGQRVGEDGSPHPRGQRVGEDGSPHSRGQRGGLGNGSDG